jgi:hypothetical protein
VIIVVLENEVYNNVIDNASAPYENSLASEFALATNYYAISHPSEPNYIAMIAGTTFNITKNGNVSHDQESTTNLVDLFRAKNVSWKAYEESMPTDCDTNNSFDGLYVTKHDPFVYMSDIIHNSTYCAEHIVGLTQLYKDLASNQLPQYSFITPNIDDDGHDTNIAFADNWLSGFMPKIINSSSFGSSVVFVTFDEGNKTIPGPSGNHITMLIVGPPSIVRSGFRSAVAYSHYSLLATVEAIYGVGNLGRNDTNATVMSDVFVTNSLNGNAATT